MNSNTILHAFLLFLVFSLAAQGINLRFDPLAVKELFIGDRKNVSVIFSNLTLSDPDLDADCSTYFDADPVPSTVLNAVLYCASFRCQEYDSGKHCNVSMELEGRALGLAKVFIQQIVKNSTGFAVKTRIPKPSLNVAVLRPPKVIHKVFNALVATIVSLNYINMGCALEMKIVKSVIRKPIGPIVGMVCQFIVMPLVAYGVGLLVFTDPVQRLGLFTFGSSPSGGASNMWTVLLRGNLNLSITMTFFSSILSIGTIPLWLFTLGKDIVRGTTITIPYENIGYSLVALVIPVCVGLLIQRYLPKVAALCRRILAPTCILMIIIIIILGSIAYWELLLTLTWRIVIAASMNVWLGFLAGCLASVLFRFSKEDLVAVAVETGIQNTGIAYILLNYSLDPPANELASIIPVAASIITPLPLFVVFCVQRIKDRWCASQDFQLQPLTTSEKISKDKIKGVENFGIEN